MRVLWITNIVFPEADAIITGNTEFKTSGGWLLGMLESIKKYSDFELFTATVSSSVQKLVTIKVDSITHYIFPRSRKHYKYVKRYEEFWRLIINDCQPDIVHIWGTENVQALPCVRLFPSLKYVVNIQGLMSEICYHYLDGLTIKEILSSVTLRDILRTGMLREERRLKKRGECEIEVLKSVGHIVGRTSWDRAVVLAINPKAKYYVGNETLRSPFYSGRWEYKKCIPHTIFLSQIAHPFKGFHQLLKALPILLSDYPDLQVRIAGPDVMKMDCDWRKKIRLNGYGNLLRKKVKHLNLRDKLVILNTLNAEEIKKELLKSNVFVSCSSIDNSPNSLGEAQMLGVPCVASYVGGVPDMVPNDQCGLLYRFEDYQMLAFHIKKIFEEAPLFDNSVMREVAESRHNAERNSSQLLELYHNIVKIP